MKNFFKHIISALIKGSGFTVCLDAGHGGSDPGAVNEIFGINEKDVSLSIAKKLELILRERKYNPILIRDKDEFISLENRADVANAVGADIFVSIHCNSVSDKEVSGIETHCYPNSSSGKKLSLHVQESVMKEFPSHKDRGVKESDFQVLRDTTMPACLFEAEFISNDIQAQFLNDLDVQDRIATALADGIENYFAS